MSYYLPLSDYFVNFQICFVVLLYIVYFCHIILNIKSDLCHVLYILFCVFFPAYVILKDGKKDQ